MLDQLQSFIKNVLSKLNFLDYEERLSISNITVAVFVFICATRMLLGGSSVNLHYFTWNIQQIDASGTLPVLYSLLNYSHKRQITSTTSTTGANS